MIRVLVRKSQDVSYLVGDRADELEGCRDAAGWWWRGGGDATSERDVAAVLRTSPRSSVTGYDLVFAAPRAISILLALDPTSSGALVEAQRRAVGGALDYLERRALVVPVTHDGERFGASAAWAQVVGFTHGINRAGEPHLHDHVLVGARPAQHRGVLDSRALRVHLPAADALYRAALRFEVNATTSWRVWARAGSEHVAGVDEGYRALWPGHDDRRAPKQHWSREAAVGRWRDERERLWPIGTLEPPNTTGFDAHAYAAAFEGALSIHRADLVRAWADASPYGAAPGAVDRAIDTQHPGRRFERGLSRYQFTVDEARSPVREGPVRTRPAQRSRDIGLDEWSRVR